MRVPWGRALLWLFYDNLINSITETQKGDMHCFGWHSEREWQSFKSRFSDGALLFYFITMSTQWDERMCNMLWKAWVTQRTVLKERSLEWDCERKLKFSGGTKGPFQAKSWWIAQKDENEPGTTLRRGKGGQKARVGQHSERFRCHSVCRWAVQESRSVSGWWLNWNMKKRVDFLFLLLFWRRPSWRWDKCVSKDGRNEKWKEVCVS